MMLIKFKTLQGKFLFFSIGGTLIFTMIISGIVHWNYRKSLTDELQRRSEILSLGLVMSNQKAILMDDKVRMQQITTEYKSLDEDIVYIVITDSNGIIIYHTFESGFPQDLLGICVPGEKTTTIETELGPIDNVSRGIVDGKAGYVHIGISTERIRNAITMSFRRHIIMIALIGTIGFIVISYIVLNVTRRIIKVITASQKLGQGDMNIRLDIDAEDETGQLAQSFNAMADALEENQRQVQQAEKLAAIGRLVSSVAHEINNPMMGIRNSFKLIEQMPEIPDKARKYIDLIDESLVGIEKIVGELLSFSRQKVEKWQPFDVRDVIEKSIDLVYHIAKEKNVVINKDYCENCRQILGDSNEFQQVILNMIVNAFDAMPDGGDVTIKSICSSGKDFATIEIIDEGFGIPTDQIDKIFEPFFTTKDTQKGTGLGLYVCHEIINKMGGSISVTSEPGVGSKFSIVMPTLREKK